MGGVFKSSAIEAAVKLLDIFNDANQQRQGLNKAKFEEFYNDAINKEVSLQDHLK